MTLQYDAEPVYWTETPMGFSIHYSDVSFVDLIRRLNGFQIRVGELGFAHDHLELSMAHHRLLSAYPSARFFFVDHVDLSDADLVLLKMQCAR